MELWTHRCERLAVGAVLQTDGGDLQVEHQRPHQGRYLVRFAGVVDRPGADALRGRILRAEPVEEPGVLWVHELVGSMVRSVGGVELGRVVSVEANPASDLLVLESGALIPLRFLVSFESLEAGREVVVDPPPGLLDETED